MTDKTPPVDFSSLSFEGFRELAKSPSLSRHQKVGFPDSYREGREIQIFDDIKTKLANLSLPGKTVLEIGPGCSDLPVMLSQLCVDNSSRLIFIDSEEMLAHLPAGENVIKYCGQFPAAIKDDWARWAGAIDVIVAYSVIQYVFAEGNLWNFLDRCLLLLADGGEILFGDVPNITMRKRFFASEAGYASHRQFTGDDQKPVVRFNVAEPGHIDDSVVLAMLGRARAQGFHAWVVPQAGPLPMSNRREDILIRKP